MAKYLPQEHPVHHTPVFQLADGERAAHLSNFGPATEVDEDERRVRAIPRIHGVPSQVRYMIKQIGIQDKLDLNHSAVLQVEVRMNALCHR